MNTPSVKWQCQRQRQRQGPIGMHCDAPKSVCPDPFPILSPQASKLQSCKLPLGVLISLILLNVNFNAPDTLCELLTVCAIYSVSRTELIRFVCRIGNVQQSFRIRVNIVTIAGEAEGLHHFSGRNTCYICAQTCFRPLANSSNITFFGISVTGSRLYYTITFQVKLR